MSSELATPPLFLPEEEFCRDDEDGHGVTGPVGTGRIFGFRPVLETVAPADGWRGVIR
jgi:hypothetical protein